MPYICKSVFLPRYKYGLAKVIKNCYPYNGNILKRKTMTNSNNSGDLIHVSSYTRGDGTQVDDYYRHNSGGGSFSESATTSNTPSFANSKTFSQECPSLTKLFGSASMNEAPVPVPDPEVILKGGVEVIRVVLDGVVKVAKVAVETVLKALPIVTALYGAYQTGKVVYDKVSSFLSPKQAQTQVKTVNVAIQGLRETQNLQKSNIDLLSKKAVNTSNQEEYSKLYSELAKQNAQYQKNNKLLDKIEYSAQNNDYASVQKGLEEYLGNANQTIGELTPLKGAVEKTDLPEFDMSYFEQDLPYQWDASHTSFEKDHEEKLSLSAQIQKNITQNIDTPSLSQRYYRISLTDLASIDSTDNDNIKMKLGDVENVRFKDFIEQKHNLNDNENVVIPKLGADLCTAVEASPELKAVIKINYNAIKNDYYLNKSIGLNFKDSISPDLALTIGKSELYNPHIDGNGNFSALVVDYYDFAEMKYKPIVSYINNNAYEQQEKDALKNYVIIVPVNIDAQTLQGIINEK